MKTSKPGSLRVVRKTRTKTLRIGFLPMNDCAPLIVAKEYGIFEKYGLNVELRRRPSWKDIHLEMAYSELEVAHAPAVLPLLMNLGITPLQARCVTGLLLGLQGNALTISEELWRKGIRDAEGLGKEIVRTTSLDILMAIALANHGPRWRWMPEWVAAFRPARCLRHCIPRRP